MQGIRGGKGKKRMEGRMEAPARLSGMLVEELAVMKAALLLKIHLGNRGKSIWITEDFNI